MSEPLEQVTTKITARERLELEGDAVRNVRSLSATIRLAIQQYLTRTREEPAE